MSNKLIEFLKTKEHVDLLRVIGQIIVFVVVIILISFFCSLIAPNLYDITTLLQTICILIGLLIVLVISGGIEISIGDLFKIKKDTEEIKKNMAVMAKSISSIKSNIKVENQFSFTPTIYQGPPVQSDLATTTLTTEEVLKDELEKIWEEEEEKINK